MKGFRSRTVKYRLTAIILILLTLLGCSQSGNSNGEKNTESVKIDEAFNLQIKNSSDFTLVSENKNFQLYIKSLTAEIKVVDKNVNAEWYSNPQNRNNDKYANNQDSRDKLISQLNIEYNNVTTNGQSTYSSYSDGINNNPVTYEKIDDGIRVNFLIGKKPVIYLAPEILSIERALKFRAKLDDDYKSFFDSIYKKVSLKDFSSDADRAAEKARHSILAKRDAYIAQMQFTDPAGLGENRFASTYLLKKIYDMFDIAGYTLDDLNRDDIENEVKKVYDPDKTAKVSIEYEIDSKGFIATIPKDSISFGNKFIQVTKLTLLPYFGAADDSKSGYIFVPDGSGALINLNNNKKLFGSYQKQLYGRDRAVFTDQLFTSDEQMYMPVFGIKQDNNAFLGIIEKGDAAAEICADISGKISQENTVSAKFNINSNCIATSQGLSVELGLRYQKKLLDSDLQVRYVFMYGDKANYTNMALAYQKYLLENNKMVKQEFDREIPLFINTVGSIIKNKSVLGIPVEKPLSLTTFKQTVDILKELKNKGANKFILQTTYWCNNSNLNTPFNKVDILDELGGDNGFKKLLKYTKDNNIDLYPETNFQYVSKSGWFSGYKQNSDASRTLDNLVAYDYDFNVATSQNKNTRRTIVSPTKYSNLISSFLKEYDSFNNKYISLATLGKDLNPDYRDTLLIDRQKSEEIVIQQIRDLSDKGYKIAVDGGNAYTLNGVALIYNAPTDSSNENIFDETVPFYQIVLHGILPYTGNALNMSSDFETDILKHIETGSIPSFKWIYENNDILTDTTSNYYSITYKEWVNKAVTVYDDLNNSLSGCQNSIIVDHSILSDGVVRVKYSNGIIIYINYNYDQKIVDNLTIVPRSYYVKTNPNINQTSKELNSDE